VGKAHSGRKDSDLEKDNVDIADDQLIPVVTAWLLLIGAIRLRKRHSPHGTALRSTCPTGTVNSKYVRRHAQAACQQRESPAALREGFQEAKREFGGEVSYFPIWLEFRRERLHHHCGY